MLLEQLEGEGHGCWTDEHLYMKHVLLASWSTHKCVEIHVYYMYSRSYTCSIHVIHMFYICNKCIDIQVYYMYSKYICNTHVLHM